MRWLALAIVGSLLIVLQTSLVPHFGIWGARPDLLLVLVVFSAMHGRMPDAAVGAWVLGALADLMTIERPGLLALSFMLITVMVASVREYVFRYRSLTQFFVTFSACFIAQTMWLIYRRLLYEPGCSIWADFGVNVLISALYTGVLAPPFHKMLLPLSKVLGIDRPRYSYAGLERITNTHV